MNHLLHMHPSVFTATANSRRDDQAKNIKMRWKSNLRRRKLKTKKRKSLTARERSRRNRKKKDISWHSTAGNNQAAKRTKKKKVASIFFLRSQREGTHTQKKQLMHPLGSWHRHKDTPRGQKNTSNERLAARR